MARPHLPLREFHEIPINIFFGYELTEQGDGTATVSMPARAEFAQETGVVQGGVLTALADTAAAYALIPTLVDQSSMAGIELKMTFLRAAKADGSKLVACARTLKRGRTISVVETELSQMGRQIAKGSFTFLHYFVETQAS